jgi:hypothetical protein
VIREAGVGPVGVLNLKKRTKIAKEKQREAIQYSSCEIAAGNTHSQKAL